ASQNRWPRWCSFDFVSVLSSSTGQVPLRDGNGRDKRQVQALNRQASLISGAPVRCGQLEATSQGQALPQIRNRFTGWLARFAIARFLPRCGWRCKLAGMPPNKIGKLAPVPRVAVTFWSIEILIAAINSRNMNVGHLPDHTPIKSLCDGFV